MHNKKYLLLILSSAAIFAFSIYFVIIRYPVDNYLMGYSDLGRSITLMKFYEKPKLSNKKNIYYWGPSFIKESINANLLDNLLDANNYNLGNPASTPLRRIFELKPFLKLKPDIIVWGISYMSLSGKWLKPLDQYALISPYNKSCVNKIYRKDIASLLSYNDIDLLLYKRKFILSALFTGLRILSHKIFNKTPPLSYEKYNTDFKSQGILTQIKTNSDPKYLSELEKKHSFSEYAVPAYPNNEMKATEYIISSFISNNIKIIIINIPLHPSLLKLIPSDSKRNFDLFMSSISRKYNVTILDYEGVFDKSDFYDGHHLNVNNIENFTKMVANNIRRIL